MTATTTRSRKPRTIRPAVASVVVLRRMAYPCVLLPNGQSAHITLNSKLYAVTADGDETTQVFTFHGEAGQSHQVCRGECTCESFVFVREARGEACKHVLAVEILKADGTI